MPSQRSLQRGRRQVRGEPKGAEGGADWLQTSLAMNFDLLPCHLVMQIAIFDHQTTKSVVTNGPLCNLIVVCSCVTSSSEFCIRVILEPPDQP